MRRITAAIMPRHLPASLDMTAHVLPSAATVNVCPVSQMRLCAGDPRGAWAIAGQPGGGGWITEPDCCGRWRVSLCRAGRNDPVSPGS